MASLPTTSPSPNLRALHDRLDAVRAGCYAQLRAPFGITLNLFPHNEIAALNPDLEIVRCLNAARRPWHRSSEVTAWATPVISTTILLSPRDIIPVLDIALRVVARELDREAHNRALAVLEANPHAWPSSERPPVAGPDAAAPFNAIAS